MEDTKDKIRRNLVLFSAVYIVGAFLKIDPSMASPWVPEMLKNVSPVRLQIVFLAVLVYLVFRWFSSEEQRNEFVKLRTFWQSTMGRLCRADGMQAMESHQGEKSDVRVKAWIKNNLSRNRSITRGFKAVTLKGWMRFIRVDYYLLASEKNGSGGSDSFEMFLDVRQPLWRWVARHLGCLYYSLRSEHFWEWVAPLAVAYAALAVIIARLSTFAFS